MNDTPRTLDDAVDYFSEVDLTKDGLDDEDEPRAVEAAEADDDDEAQDAETEADEADEGDEDDEEPDDDEDEDEPEAADLVEVWNGKEFVRVSREDAKGYALRQQDYTRKTMEVAEQRRAIEQERASIAEMRQQLENSLAQWAIQEQPEPDWVTLAQQMDPYQFQVAQAQWHAEQRHIEQAKAQYQNLVAQQHQEVLQRGQKEILDSFPEWRDPAVAQREVQEIARVGMAAGFTAEELSSITDPRMVKVLHWARQFRAMQDKASTADKRIVRADKSLRPGAKTTAGQQSSKKAEKAMKQFRQSRSMDAALAALNALDG